MTLGMPVSLPLAAPDLVPGLVVPQPLAAAGTVVPGFAAEMAIALQPSGAGPGATVTAPPSAPAVEGLAVEGLTVEGPAARQAAAAVPQDAVPTGAKPEARPGPAIVRPGAHPSPVVPTAAPRPDTAMPAAIKTDAATAQVPTAAAAPRAPATTPEPSRPASPASQPPSTAQAPEPAPAPRTAAPIKPPRADVTGAPEAEDDEEVDQPEAEPPPGPGPAPIPLPVPTSLPQLHLPAPVASLLPDAPQAETPDATVAATAPTSTAPKDAAPEPAGPDTGAGPSPALPDSRAAPSPPGRDEAARDPAAPEAATRATPRSKGVKEAEPIDPARPHALQAEAPDRAMPHAAPAPETPPATHAPPPSPAAAAIPTPATPTPATPPPAPPAAARPSPAPPPGPIAQLGGAFVSLPPAKEGAPQTLVIRLDPGELGRVQIKVERTGDGPARVDLAVERPDTLMLLMQDRPRLDQVLTAAGVPPEGRALSFSLGDPQPGPSGGGSDGRSGDRPEQGGGAPDRGWDDTPNRERRAAKAWARAGIDITA